MNTIQRQEITVQLPFDSRGQLIEKQWKQLLKMKSQDSDINWSVQTTPLLMKIRHYELLPRITRVPIKTIIARWVRIPRRTFQSSQILNILGLSFTNNDLSWIFHISCLAKTVYVWVGSLSSLPQFYSPSQLRELKRHCMEYALQVRGVPSTLLFYMDRAEARAFHPFNISLLTAFTLSLTDAMLPHLPFYTNIFMLTFLLILLFFPQWPRCTRLYFLSSLYVYLFSIIHPSL